MGHVSPETVGNFLKSLITAGEIFQVTNEGLITDADGKPVKFIKDDTPTSGYVYGLNVHPPADALIINPLVEGIGTKKQRAWFTVSRTVVITSIVKELFIRTAECVVEGNDEDIEVAALCAPYADLVDAKTAKELDKLAPKEYLHLAYSREKKEASIGSIIFDDNELGEYKLRKKTVKFLRKYMADILGTTDLSKYTVKSTLLCADKFEAFTKLYVKLWEQLCEFTELILDISADLAVMKDGIERLKEFHASCKWFVTDPAVVEKSKESSLPPWRVDRTATRAKFPTIDTKPRRPAKEVEQPEPKKEDTKEYQYSSITKQPQAYQQPVQQQYQQPVQQQYQQPPQQPAPQYSQPARQLQSPYGQPAQQLQPPYGQPAQQLQPPYGQPPAMQLQPPYGQPAQQLQPPYGQPAPQMQPPYGQPAQPMQPPYGQPAPQMPQTYGQPAQQMQQPYRPPAQQYQPPVTQNPYQQPMGAPRVKPPPPILKHK